MSNIAVIGLGEIGSIISEKLIEHNVIDKEYLYVYDRNKTKMENLEKKYKDINLCFSAEESVKNAKHVFVCIQPQYIPSLIKELMYKFFHDVHLCISSSNISFNKLSNFFDGKITKFLPTINSSINRGVIFASHNNKVLEEEKEFFNQFMLQISGKYYEISEKEFPLLNNIAGCAPAFIAYFSFCMCRAAFEMEMKMPYEIIEDIFKETLIGTSLNIESNNNSFEEIIDLVGKPNGITYTALSALKECLPDATEKLIERGVKRHKQIDAIVSEIFSSCL